MASFISAVPSLANCCMRAIVAVTLFATATTVILMEGFLYLRTWVGKFRVVDFIKALHRNSTPDSERGGEAHANSY